jgi:WD40 repeat protein
MKSWLPWSLAALLVGLCFAWPAGLWAAEEEATPVFDWIKPNQEAKQVPPVPAPKKLPPYQNPFAGDAELGPLFEHGAPPVYRPVRKLEGHTDRVVAVAISADGKIGVTCAANGQCWSWDLATGKKLAAYEKTLPGRKFVAALTSDGKYASIGCEQEGVFSWETATGKLAKLHKDELNARRKAVHAGQARHGPIRVRVLAE